MPSIRVAKTKLLTPREKSDKHIKDLNLGDDVWITEGKTGLLVKAIIVHEVHVPGKYVEKLKKYEKSPNNRVWAKQELGNARFKWFALYADAKIEESTERIKEEDKYLNFYSVKNLYKDPDFTSSLEPMKKQIPVQKDFKKLLRV